MPGLDINLPLSVCGVRLFLYATANHIIGGAANEEVEPTAIGASTRDLNYYTNQTPNQFVAVNVSI